MLFRSITGEYRVELLSYIGMIKLSKAEIMSLLRTFMNAITFRTPHSFAHAKTMETIVSLLGQMTKQNWHMMEKVRAASLLYNIGMLTLDEETFAKDHSPIELYSLLREAIKDINVIFKEAELIDIVDMFNATIGETTFSDKHMLMGKDIISGSKMINIADVLASLMEQRCSAYEISCRDTFDELKEISKTEDLYLPLIELMEDYVDDIEARVKSSRTEVEKQYRNVISGFEKLRRFLIHRKEN